MPGRTPPTPFSGPLENPAGNVIDSGAATIACIIILYSWYGAARVAADHMRHLLAVVDDNPRIRSPDRLLPKFSIVYTCIPTQKLKATDDGGYDALFVLNEIRT